MDKENERLKYEGYPHHCYVMSPVSMRTSMCFPGDCVFYAVHDKMLALRPPQLMNQEAGVTAAQQAAMWWAMANHDWNDTHANPMAYNAAGAYLGE